MQTLIKNQLATIRRNRGVGATDLARQVGISRQTIYAIETGAYVPNTEVTLKLARILEVSVEELFSLETDKPVNPQSMSTDILSATKPVHGQPVRVCQVGDRWVSVPVSASPYYLPEADGVISKVNRSTSKADLVVLSKEEASQKKLVFAGCDPAMSLLARMVEKLSGVEIVPAAASSRLSLTWLKEGKVHIAGSHLEDPETGDFNLPFIRRELPDEDFTVITFAHWEEGFVTATGNPKDIQKPEHLTRKNVRFINREPGSGSRSLLDKLIAEAGISAKKIAGYDRIAYGHLAAAYAVLTEDADCCLATRSAAQTFGLGFVPLRSERYDLVMRKRTLEMPAAQSFFDVLQRSTLRRKLEVLAGYDTTQTGAILA